jgi:hypothetical protein
MDDEKRDAPGGWPDRKMRTWLIIIGTFLASCLAGVVLVPSFIWPGKAIVVEAGALYALASLVLLVLLLLETFQPTSDVGNSPPSAGDPSSKRRTGGTPVVLVAIALFTLSAALISVDRIAPPHGTTNPSRPIAGQVIYRIYGGSTSKEYGASWTPVNPMLIGSSAYRIVAGLPDERNAGTHLVYGLLESPADVETVKPAEPVNAGSGAYCSYPGGLVEYVIPSAKSAVLAPKTTDLEPPYGGYPGPCDKTT